MEKWNSVIVYRKGLEVKALDSLDKSAKTKFSTLINESIKEVIQREGYELFQSFNEVEKIVQLVSEALNVQLASGEYDHVLNFNFNVNAEEFLKLIELRLKTMRKKKPTEKQVAFFESLKKELNVTDLVLPEDFLLFEEYLGNLLSYSKLIGKPTEKQVNSVVKRWEYRYGETLFQRHCTDREEISMFFKALEMTPSNGEAFMLNYMESRRARLERVLKAKKNNVELNFLDAWYLRNDEHYCFMNGFVLFCDAEEVDLIEPFDFDDDEEYFTAIEPDNSLQIARALIKHINQNVELLPVYVALTYLHQTEKEDFYSSTAINELVGLSELTFKRAMNYLTKHHFITQKRFRDAKGLFYALNKGEETYDALLIDVQTVNLLLLEYKQKEISLNAFETYVYLHSLPPEDIKMNGKYESGDLSFVSTSVWEELSKLDKVQRVKNDEFVEIVIK